MFQDDTLYKLLTYLLTYLLRVHCTRQLAQYKSGRQFSPTLGLGPTTAPWSTSLSTALFFGVNPVHPKAPPNGPMTQNARRKFSRGGGGAKSKLRGNLVDAYV